MAVMSRSQKPGRTVPVDERFRVVLAVLQGEMSVAEAARRHGVTATTISNWRDRFIEAGKGGLENKISGPAHGGTVAERRLRSENEQLKLALAEQMVQLRLWQKGAEHIEDVPSVTSKP
jgi:transposase